ncbi:MAG: hypothetical protein COB50_00890 [Thiotrichales bacterium]|nr:MAG: hypothetical protein COB50_00890 [Thiotrichales bacterium]
MKCKITISLVNWENSPNRKPLILKGARQVGKTYVLKKFGEENFVVQEFMFSSIGKIFNWQKNTAEVEFVVTINGDILPIEVKSENVTQAKSLQVFAKKYQPKYRTIMSAKELCLDHENKVHRYPLYLAAKFPLMAVF